MKLLNSTGPKPCITLMCNRCIDLDSTELMADGLGAGVGHGIFKDRMITLPNTLPFAWADFFASVGIGVAAAQKNLSARIERRQNRPGAAAGA